jgi:hypothetical protein
LELVENSNLARVETGVWGRAPGQRGLARSSTILGCIVQPVERYVKPPNLLWEHGGLRDRHLRACVSLACSRTFGSQFGFFV